MHWRVLLAVCEAWRACIDLNIVLLCGCESDYSIMLPIALIHSAVLPDRPSAHRLNVLNVSSPLERSHQAASRIGKVLRRTFFFFVDACACRALMQKTLK